MKRSSYVPLLVLGTAAGMVGCSSSVDLKQQRYASREDCLRDWNDESSCQPDQRTGSGGSGGSGGGGGGGGNWGGREEYRGPRYYWDHDTGRPMIVSADGTVSPAPHARIGADGSRYGQSFHAGSITRRGFGSFRGFSMGG